MTRGPMNVAPSGWRMNHSFMMGACMVVNAVRDCVVVIDGPDCSHFKGQLIAGKHDLMSTLYVPGREPRIVHTDPGLDRIAVDREEEILARVVDASRAPGTGAVLLTSLPACSVTGADYPRIAREASERGDVPVIHVPGESLRGDWLDGYQRTLEAIARGIVLPDVDREPDAVAVVGLVMDRTEGDHLGNIGELGRLCSSIGLDLVSTWPSAGSWSELGQVARAGTIVSLPGGRQAAEVLAQRTGATLVKVDDPVGIEATRRWLERLAGATGRDAVVGRVLDAEISRAVSRLERVMGFYLVGRSAALVTDLHLAPGLAELLSDLGVSIDMAVVQAEARHMEARVDGWPAPGAAPVFEPNMDELLSDLLLREQPFVDLVICSGDYAPHFSRVVPVVEMGFPSLTHHVLADAPFMGFEGALGVVSRILDALGGGLP